ncbi:MAG: hypothetical protein PWQ22_586 [Archaeoglobaceae archaeon]|nr:hypothetical protein [Archaeoglobaceae archaeon]
MKWIPKQKRVGRFIGGVKELLARVTFYISILNFLMIIVTTYYTTIRHIYNIPFWVFFATLAVIVIVAMVFEYTIVLPSQIAFLNWQAYTHDNPIRKDLEKIMSKLEEIEKLVKEKESGG